MLFYDHDMSGTEVVGRLLTPMNSYVQSTGWSCLFTVDLVVCFCSLALFYVDWIDWIVSVYLFIST